MVGTLVQSFMVGRESWQGTSTELLAELEQAAEDAVRKRREWPKSPRKLSGDLRRVAPNLRRAGLDVRFQRGVGKDRKRTIRLTQADGTTGSGAGGDEYRPTCNSLWDGALGQGTDGTDGTDGCVRRIEDLDDDDRFAWDERVATCTNDGGLSRAEAEDVAWREIESRQRAETAKGQGDE